MSDYPLPSCCPPFKKLNAYAQVVWTDSARAFRRMASCKRIPAWDAFPGMNPSARHPAGSPRRVFLVGLALASPQSLELRNRRGANARRRYRRYLISISDSARIGHLTCRGANQTSVWSDSP